MFANKYIQKHCDFPPYIQENLLKGTAIIVVIPCMDEPDILTTLESLHKCKPSRSLVEVIIVVNESEIADERIKNVNQETHQSIKEWATKLDGAFISFQTIYPKPFPKKWAGAGLARKVGMDEAIRRFNTLNSEKGILLSLDADTLVDKNYFIEVENYFNENPEGIGANIKFKHITEGIEARLKEGIELYEAYMTYYKEAHAFMRFPFAMYTIGSAFAVIAEAYVKQGGMVKRPAGEDFYFLHKLTTLGTVGSITNTCVYPSARVSSRVPFGTGPNMRRWMNKENDLRLTYNFHAFIDLKILFDKKGHLYKISENEYMFFQKQLPAPVKDFLLDDDFFKQLKSLNENCATIESFQLRFFHIFNAFKILKFLNYGHLRHYKRVDLYKQMEQLKLMNS